MQKFWFILGVWLVVSCNDIRECGLSTSRDFAVIAFYEADSLEKYRKDTILIGDILHPDTLVPSGNVNAILLEMSPENSEIIYQLELNGEEYLLQMQYERRLEIYYDECEPVFTYKLDSVYGPDFDSVALLAEPLDEAIQVNVEIYF